MATATVEQGLDDLWVRDYGAIFVLFGDGGEELGAVDLGFNGWGGKQRHALDGEVAGEMAVQAGAGTPSTTFLRMEGGGVEVDGHGTAIVTESCILNANRNPGVSKVEAEAELKRLLGLRKVIWLPGIAGAEITDGHVDFYARFAAPGVVVAALDNDPDSFDYQVTRDHLSILQSATDADGRLLEVIPLPGPSYARIRRRDEDDMAAGYVNYYVGNGFVLVPEFGDEEADGYAANLLAELYPGRTIEVLNIDNIAAGGGGIHCATMQQPASSVSADGAPNCC